MNRKREAFLFLLALAFLVFSFSSGVRAANLSTEQQLDVLAARVAANENAFFNETNATGLVFEKQGFGPYHSIFHFVSIYAPREKPWNEIFEINTERSIGDLDRSDYFNGFLVYLALPEVACPGCYTTRPAPDKFKALFYCPKTRGKEYPNYPVYWEGNSFTPEYKALLSALTKSCLEAQDEIARLEAFVPSPSPLPSPSLSPSPSAAPSVRLSPSPSIVAANESNSANSTNSSNASAVNGLVTVFAKPAQESGLVAAGSVSEDEQWVTYAALLLVVGCIAIVAFYARKK